MRVLLISANRFQEPYPVYPLGTAYLKAYLAGNLPEAEVEVLDLNLVDDASFCRQIAGKQPDFVGMSFRNVDGANSLDRRGFLPQYKEWVRMVRRATRAPLIIGGAAFSIFPEVFMRELEADYGIGGEGEYALCRLLSALWKKEPVSGIPSLYVGRNEGGSRDGGYAGENAVVGKAAAVTGAATGVAAEGKALPGKAGRSGSGKESCRDGKPCYIDSPRAEYEEDLVRYYWKESGMLNIQTKRGCPYRCIYCTYPRIDGCKVRTMDISSLVETVLRAKRDFGADYWFFTDSVFNISNPYNMALAQAFVDSRAGISWGAYFSPMGIDDEQMALYKASGLKHIEFGTESFCDRTLASYGKLFGFDQVLRASETALKHNVYYAHFLILGGWGETRQQLDETISNSRYLRHTVIFPYVGMRVYPGTLLQRCMVQAGCLDAADDLLEPRFYIAEGFDLADVKQKASSTGKAWVFPDAPQEALAKTLRLKKNKKGPLWEYLRKA